jgi:hypothetical protein
MFKNSIKIIKNLGALFMSTCLLSACSSEISYYKNQPPELNLQRYLQGKIVGSGIIKDWHGRVTQQFDFSADASWEKDICTFKEEMKYYNGKIDHRTWIIKKINDHYYEGSTAELIGIAKIFVEGNAMNWQYKMDVNVNGSTYRLSFDDWMYLMKNNTLINQNKFKKFGITVGSLVLFMQKSQDN